MIINYLQGHHYPAIPLVCESELKELEISGRTFTQLRGSEKGGPCPLLLYDGYGGLSEYCLQRSCIVLLQKFGLSTDPEEITVRSRQIYMISVHLLALITRPELQKLIDCY